LFIEEINTSILDTSNIISTRINNLPNPNNGIDGIDGAVGAVGPIGGIGPKGNTGNTGGIGPKGNTGNTGNTGGQGIVGRGLTNPSYNATTGILTLNFTDAINSFNTTDIRGAQGIAGRGLTNPLYNATTGILTLNCTDAINPFNTTDIRGSQGIVGRGLTTPLYNATTGILTLNFTDAINSFSTGNIRGAQGIQGIGGRGISMLFYNETTGVLTLTFTDGLNPFSTGNIRGDAGRGLTTPSYNTSTGVLTLNFTDGINSFSTGNIRGAQGIQGIQGIQGDNYALPIASVSQRGGIRIGNNLFLNGDILSGLGGSRWGASGTTINYSGGNVGIGNTNPLYQLSLGTHLINGGDGKIYIGKNTGNGSSRFFTIKYNDAYDMCFSDSDNKDVLKVSHSAPANSLFINGSGNVGIGTATPQCRMTIRTNYSDENTGFMLDAMDTTNSYNIKFFSYVIGNGLVGHKFKLQNQNSIHDNMLCFGANGNVGIGNNNPSYKLTVQGNVFVATNLIVDGLISCGNNVNLNANAEIGSTLTVGGNVFASPAYNGGFYSGDSGWGFKISNFGNGEYWTEARGYWHQAGRGFRCFNVTNNSVPFVVNFNNCVGINQTNPSVRLHVEGGGVNTGAVSRFFGNNATGVGSNGSLGDTVIYAAGSIHSTSWFGSSSDIRIKKDIQDLDDAEMLEKVLLLKPVKYAYLDKEKTDDLVYGFIAQDVREVMGNEGVHMMKDFIFDINENALINDGVITFNGILEVGLIYRVFHKEKEAYIIIKIDGKTSENTYTATLELDGEIENSDIFIVGKRVDDFHSLNKNAIFTMGIGAIQELHRTITRQQVIIDNLTNRIELMELIEAEQLLPKIDDLIARINILENRSV